MRGKVPCFIGTLGNVRKNCDYPTSGYGDPGIGLSRKRRLFFKGIAGISVGGPDESSLLKKG